MKYKVKILKPARENIFEIFKYIKNELNETEIASKQAKAIEEAIFNLDLMPLRHPVYDKEPWRSKGIRRMPVNNYSVFYFVNSDKNTVSVVNVLYSGMDIDKQLKN